MHLAQTHWRQCKTHRRVPTHLVEAHSIFITLPANAGDKIVGSCAACCAREFHFIPDGGALLTRLSQARLSQARFSQARLSQASLCQVRISQARLRQTRLSQARLRQARLSQARQRDEICRLFEPLPHQPIPCFMPFIPPFLLHASGAHLELI